MRCISPEGDLNCISLDVYAILILLVRINFVAVEIALSTGTDKKAIEDPFALIGLKASLMLNVNPCLSFGRQEASVKRVLTCCSKQLPVPVNFLLAFRRAVLNVIFAFDKSHFLSPYVIVTDPAHRDQPHYHGIQLLKLFKKAKCLPLLKQELNRNSPLSESPEIRPIFNVIFIDNFHATFASRFFGNFLTTFMQLSLVSPLK